MKKPILFVSLNILFILFGCNSSSNNTENETKQNEPQVAAEATSCYVLANSKDTVSLKITIDKNHVSGDLLYHYFEKDRNTGTINGEVKGDTIFATYTFISEGIESKRGVVFLKKEDELIEGYAAMDPATGEPDLSDHSAIKFDEKFVLKKSDCE
jgi:hypothetical protein